MDITTVFGTVIGGSSPSGPTRVFRCNDADISEVQNSISTCPIHIGIQYAASTSGFHVPSAHPVSTFQGAVQASQREMYTGSS